MLTRTRIAELKQYFQNAGLLDVNITEDNSRYPVISELIGKTFLRVENQDNDQIVFISENEVFTFCHDQDCCEGVSIEDIEGDLNDLIGSPILLAEENTNSDESEETKGCEEFTWTFYRFATIKGYVVIRWFGESNGYYSTDVSLHKHIIK